MKIAFCGASGTGKTKLTEFISKEYNIPICPVGARTVAKEMGLNSPYESDVTGIRDEFQTKLLESKYEWESQHESFVTDRTYLDNLVYNILHNGSKIKKEFAKKAIDYTRNYDIIFYLSPKHFINLDDPIRIKNMDYHHFYDFVLRTFLNQHVDCLAPYGIKKHPSIEDIDIAGLEQRKLMIKEAIDYYLQ